jgi:hypothetical protein
LRDRSPQQTVAALASGHLHPNDAGYQPGRSIDLRSSKGAAFANFLGSARKVQLVRIANKSGMKYTTIGDSAPNYWKRNALLAIAVGAGFRTDLLQACISGLDGKFR